MTKRISVLLIVATLFLAGMCEEEDYENFFLSSGEHSESIKTECEEGGGKYCFKAGGALEENCYSIATKSSEYCICTDGANGVWNDTAAACYSAERTECFEFKESLRSFYNGVCYTKETCIANNMTSNAVNDNSDTHPWDWISGSKAVCAPVQAICAGLADTKWTGGACTCTEVDASFHGDHCHGVENKVTTAEKWGYGIIATALISAFAVIGVLIVLMRHQWWYPLLLSTMVALAMGCLLSDATLHLIPLALGLHSHDDEEGHMHAAEEEGSGGAGHDEEEMSAGERRNITIAITFGVYLFLLFEKLIHIIIPHQHSHGGEDKVVANPNADTEMKGVGNGKTSYQDCITAVEEVEEMPERQIHCNKKRSIVNHLHEEDVATRDGSICSVDSVAWMVIIGDALHNFADGLVMGAAFTNSLATGLGTSIAVFCHEVPHELGDFAVLLNAGMKIKFAVLFNFLSACTCFLGLFVGLAIGENETAQKWIFAFTAGMFIYIACADLIPLMDMQMRTSKYPTICLILQHFGILLGFLMMYLLAIYEEEIEGVGQANDH